MEALWAKRISGVRRLADRAKEWREVSGGVGIGSGGEDALVEE